MYNRRHEPALKIRRALSRDRLRYGVCVLALSSTLGFAAPAAAQDNPVVDISDPNVSIDLSVLNDGGLSPRMGAPFSNTGATPRPDGAAYQAPGKDMPVSTLYIKPASGFKLPPQTKSIETQIVKVQAPAPTMEPVAAAEPVAAPVAEPVEIASAPPPPAAVEPPAPVSSIPEPTAHAVEPAPAAVEPVAVDPVAVEALAEAAPEPGVPSSPEPATSVAALTPPPPMSAPESASQSQPMALKAEPAPAPEPQQAVAPTPPPAPVSAPAPVAEHDETQTTSSGGNGVVIPLPPKQDTPAQVASLPPATGPLSDGDSLRIVFDADTSKLAQTARDALLDVATKMQSQDNLRLQLLAYAGTADTSASAARRLSLSRALAVRSFLIENGVRSTRIDVRALGNKSTEAVTERVDITVVER